MEEEKAITLDEEAQRLFEQFGGMQSYEKKAAIPSAERLAQGLLEEQKRHDVVRILMVQAVYLISRYLTSLRFYADDPRETKTFANLAKVLARLNQVPGHLGCLMIRYRGTPSDADMPEKYDYELVFGHTYVDSTIVRHTARRNSQQWSKLPDHLLDAFTVLSDYGVNNIFVRLPENLQAELPAMRLCMKVLSGFREACNNRSPIRIQAGNTERTIALVNDESMFPDPNLTLLAGLNRLNPASMAQMVDKVDQWLRRNDAGSEKQRHAGVYNAALAFPKIAAKVKKPPIELNNVKWLISNTDVDAQEVSAEKVHIAKLALEMAGASPQKVTKMIQSIYGDDYARINKSHLGERLHLSSDLLDAAKAQTTEAKLTKELLGNLQSRLDQVKDRVIDEVHVVEDKAEARTDGNKRPKEAVSSEIYRMVSFYKGRSNTRKKMVGMVHKTITFTDKDYEILAKDFKISREDAEALVHKLKSCFSTEGRFKKSAFSDAVDHFRKYEQKIFQFLWHHMKDVVQPDDRTAFLNALQALTTQMDQPKKAFKILLEDFCEDPEHIQYSDNKAIMLANLIIHRDKSMTDYDITPEDIVLSRHNIDAMVAQYAAWRIEKDHEAFSTKVQTVHKRLSEALQVGVAGGQRMPAGVLLNLERELYIFLSLLDCDTGRAILRSAAAEYGDPTESLYVSKHSTNCMGALLQNLRVALRGVGSVGSMTDVGMLEHVKTQEETFGRLKNDRHFRAQARLITEWVEEAVKLIKFRAQ